MLKIILFFGLSGTTVFISCFIIDFIVCFVQDVNIYLMLEKPPSFESFCVSVSLMCSLL